jgi:hypothetical protein
MDGLAGANNGCFVVFVANVEDHSTKIEATFAGESIDLGAHARIPRGSGRSLTYAPYDPDAGLPKDEVAILFLAGPGEVDEKPDGTLQFGPVRCPVAPARSSLTQVHGTGIGAAFRIRTSSPVVAYQMLPYGGGHAAVTGSTLLLPSSSYGTNYVAWSPARPGSIDVVASLDDTTVTIRPTEPIALGGAIDASPAHEPRDFHLRAGDVLQITQSRDLSGSPILADKPIAVFGGTPCMNVPSEIRWCDHGEQQIPPVSALGHEYVAVGHRARSAKPERYAYRVVGVVDGTKLSYDPPAPGPKSLNLGDVSDFSSTEPFVVRSQGATHPFALVAYMTGSGAVVEGYGDPEVVRSVPPAQYLDKYVFFTDPSYPETNLVVVRERDTPDVTLDCRGPLEDWARVGESRYEFARVDLSRHDFRPQGRCDNGRHVMKGGAPFGLTVWGWGSPETSSFTQDVSYAYAAGENIASINSVVVPPK